MGSKSYSTKLIYFPFSTSHIVIHAETSNTNSDILLIQRNFLNQVNKNSISRVLEYVQDSNQRFVFPTIILWPSRNEGMVSGKVPFVAQVYLIPYLFV